MSRPDGRDLLGHLERADLERSAAGVTEHAADVARRRRRAAAAPAPSPSVRSTARSRSGSNATTSASTARAPSASSTSVLVLPRHDVGVGHDEVVVDEEPAALLDAVQASPVDLHRRLQRPGRRPPSTGRSSSGGGPRSGAGRRASNTCGNGSSPTSRRRASIVSGGSGNRSLDLAGDGEPRACSARSSPARRPASAAAATARPARRRRRRPRPPTWSVRRAGPGGQLGVQPAAEDQAERPGRSSAVPTRRPTATSVTRELAGVLHLGQPRVAAAAAPTSSPTTRPTHDAARATNPRR